MGGELPGAAIDDALVICVACGSIAPIDHRVCVTCNRTRAEGSTVAVSGGDGYWVRLDCDVTCRACGMRSPIHRFDGEPTIECERCGQVQAFEPSEWIAAAERALEVADLRGPACDLPDSPFASVGVSQANIAIVSSGSDALSFATTSRLNLVVTPGHPVCERCCQPLILCSDDAHRVTASCSGCGERAVYDLPAAAARLVPALAGVLASDHRSDRPLVRETVAAGDVALALLCPSCGGALSAGALGATVTCSYCQAVARIPLRTLGRLRPGDGKPGVLWFWLRGPSGLRKRLTVVRDAAARGMRWDEDGRIVRPTAPRRRGLWIGAGAALVVATVAVAIKFRTPDGEPRDCVNLRERACDDGPVGSRGIGRCQPGRQTCSAATEYHWSACVDNTLPAAHDQCGDGLDDDCNGTIDDGCPPPTLEQRSCAVAGTPGCGVVEIAGGSVARSGMRYTISAFQLDAYEVTVARFRRYWREARHPGPAEFVDYPGGHTLRVVPPPETVVTRNHDGSLTKTNRPASAIAIEDGTFTRDPGVLEAFPITGINWYTAAAFCAWDGGRLATEIEWTYASFGRAVDGLKVPRKFPWGDEAPGCDRAQIFGCRGDAGHELRPVGSVPAAGGLYDLVGNVAEWTADVYEFSYRGGTGTCWSPGESGDPLCNDDGTRDRVAIGGSYRDQPNEHLRVGHSPTTGSPAIGFRCAKSR